MEEKSNFSYNCTHIYILEHIYYCIYRILAHLINWKRQGARLKHRVINEDLHICRLEFHLCVRHESGKYQSVSPASYSSIIEEGNIVLIRNIF